MNLKMNGSNIKMRIEHQHGLNTGKKDNAEEVSVCE